MAAFLRGATVYPLAVFDCDSVLERISADRISFPPGPPTLYLSMLAHPQLGEHDLTSWRSAVTGAATVPPALIRRMRDELGFTRVTTAYGLTECGGVATVNDPSDSAETIALTCGRALPGTDLRVVDADGWLHTGDVGTQDGQGYLRITDRLKDMFIVGGFNCYPAEIERMLAEHPAIAQAALVGVADERMAN